MSKVAVITGAAGNLAACVIPHFQQAGWHLALLGRSDADQQDLEKHYPNQFVGLADLAVAKDAQVVMQQVIKHYGRIDALLNLAGGFALKSASELSTDDIQKQLTINFWTVVQSAQAVLPNMLKRQSGFIAAIGAGAAQKGGSKMAAYAAAKAAMIAYLKSLEAELGQQGIRVGIVTPLAAIDTAGNRQAMPDADRSTWIDPAELATSLLFMAERSASGRVQELQLHSQA